MHGAVGNPIQVGKCSFKDLSSITCSKGDECRVITDIKSQVIKRRGHLTYLSLLLCPCDQNLATQFNYVCTSVQSTQTYAKFYDLLVIIPERTPKSISLLSYRYRCYRIEIKFVSKNQVNKHFEKFIEDLDNKFRKGFDCVIKCDIDCKPPIANVLITNIKFSDEHMERLKSIKVNAMNVSEFVGLILGITR